ncbi:MAG: UvrD-helicase domain-containing protein [Kofleriaceae bacterium]
MTARWPRPATLGDPHAPLMVVEASAGTGKTFFLEHRVVDLLLATDATLDRIVVVTYTEKATAELKARIRRLLTQLVWVEPPPGADASGWLLDERARARLRDALDRVDAAPISTIHGFCQRVLADEAFAAGRAFEQEAVPDEAAVRAAFIDALRERFAVVPADRALLHAYLADGGTPDALFRQVLALYRFGAPLAPGTSAPHQPLVAGLLDEVLARAERAKRKGGQVDFHDMLRLTARALAADPALARRIATRFPWAMIDEFQDTDPVQWQIAARIWRQPPARGLTIVGDPKQAIYSFRGGDVHTYQAATRELVAAGAAKVTLDVCQRSTTALVAAVNRLMARPRSLFVGSGIDDARPVQASGQVTAAWADGRPVAPVALLPVPIAKPIDDVRAAIYEATADEIARLCGDPAHRMIGTVRGQARAIDAGDIYVLTRTNGESVAVAEAIRRRGVPCAFLQAEHLFSTAEAADVADLLEAVARPRDPQAQVRAWMTCFFDVEPDQLARAKHAADDHPLVARFHDWRGHAARMDYPRLFRSILDDTRVIERALATGGGARTVTNLTHVLEHLYAEVERSRCELPELVARLRAMIADGGDRPDDSDLQRQETDAAAVQVMTVHRAKGLEAWVVFVVGGISGQTRGEDAVSIVHADSGERVAVLKGAGLAATPQSFEDQRLAYVAMTRARARLYLPVLPAKTKTPTVRGGWHGVYGALHDAVTDLAASGPRAAAPATPPPANVIVFPTAAPMVEPWPPAQPVTGTLDARRVELPAPPPPPAEPGELAGRTGFVVTSYSRLRRDGAELDVSTVTAEDRSRRAPGPDELPGGAATGQLIHAVLEHADFPVAAGLDLDAWLARPEVAGWFADGERRFGVDRRHRRQAAALVHATIRAPVVTAHVELPPLAAAARLAREVEFVYPIPDPPLAAGPRGPRGFVKGFIDAIVAWDQRWYVLDYKSDVVDDDPAALAHHVDEHYALQAELYALAAARMLGLRDAADTAARFGGLLYWFVRPGRIVHRVPTWADLEHYAAALGRREYA